MFQKLKQKIKSISAFTLAELLIVVAIVGVIAAIAIPVFSSQLEKSREATDLANLRGAKAAAIAKYLENDLLDGEFYFDAQKGTLISGDDFTSGCIQGYGKGTEKVGDRTISFALSKAENQILSMAWVNTTDGTADNYPSTYTGSLDTKDKIIKISFGEEMTDVNAQEHFIVYTKNAAFINPLIVAADELYQENLEKLAVVSNTDAYRTLLAHSYNDISKDQNLDVVAGVLPDPTKDGSYIYVIAAKDNSTIMAPNDVTELFANLKHIKYVNLSGMNFGNTTVFDRMFANSTGIKNVYFGPNRDGSGNVGVDDGIEFPWSSNGGGSGTSNGYTYPGTNITSAEDMFVGCENLEKIDMKPFQWVDITWMDWLFNNGGKFEELVLSDNAKNNLVVPPEYEMIADNVIKGESDSAAEKTGYKITKGANQVCNISETLSFTSNADIAKFEGVYVDNQLVDPSNYTVTEGSTIITFKDTYSSALAQKNHTLVIKSTDGDAWTTFAMSNGQEIKALLCTNGTLYFTFDNESYKSGDKINTEIGELTVSSAYVVPKEASQDTDIKYTSQAASITKVQISTSMKNCYISSTAYWFYYLTNVTTIDGLQNLKMDNVTSIRNMFYACSSLTGILDLSSWNVSNVTNMYAMFADCSKINVIDLTGWNTNNAKSNMDRMFSGCSKLTTIYASDTFVTTITTTVSNNTSMYYGCTKLVGGAGSNYSALRSKTCAVATRIDTPENPAYLTNKSIPQAKALFCEDGTLEIVFDAKNYKDGGMYFNQYSSRIITKVYVLPTTSTEYGNVPWYDNSALKNTITTIHINSNVKNCNLTGTAYWFDSFTNVTTIDGLQNLKMDNVTNTRNMFYSCNNLIGELDLSSWNVSNVTNMYCMFQACSKLNVVDLTGWNTNNAKSYMDRMFSDCSELTTIYASDTFVTASTYAVSNNTSMYYNCSKLVGGAGSNYSALRSKTCAVATRIDTPETPGFLTAK